MLWWTNGCTCPRCGPRPQRCREAGVPEEVGFQTKAELGLDMLGQARGAGHLTGQWVTADETYGQVPSFRDTLDRDGWWYVLEVPCTTPVFAEPAETGVPVGRARAGSLLDLAW
jgi:hypothetical protein